MNWAAFALPCSSARRTQMGWLPPSGIVLLRTLIASCASSRLLKLRGAVVRGREWINVLQSNTTIEWFVIDSKLYLGGGNK